MVIRMQNGFLMVALLALVGWCPLQAAAQEFSSDGFRGVRWNSDLSQREDMVVHDKSGNTVYYTRRNESLTLGNGDLVNLYYAAYRNRFYLVLAQFRGSNDREKIKYVVFREFGEPFMPDQDRLEYAWTKGDTTATLMYDERSKMGTVIYSYDPLDRKARQSK